MNEILDLEKRVLYMLESMQQLKNSIPISGEDDEE